MEQVKIFHTWGMTAQEIEVIINNWLFEKRYTIVVKRVLQTSCMAGGASCYLTITIFYQPLE